MKQRKTTALLVAMIMVAVAGMAGFVILDEENNEACPSSASHGQFNISIRSDVTTGVPANPELANISTSWATFNVSGYDATKAILNVNSQLALSSQTYSINDTYNKYVASGGYYTVDESYGQIDTMLNLASGTTNLWHAWVYTFTDNSGVDTNWEWVKVSSTAGLGHYRPFSDYSTETYQTANVALFYGTAAQASDLTLPTTIQNIVDVASMKAQGVSDYQVTVTLKDARGSTPIYYLQNYTAYGSDAYAALKDACASNGLIAPVGVDNAGQTYSWLTSINGLENATELPWTPFWALFDTSSGAPSFTNYTSGFLSPLWCGYNHVSSIQFTYGDGSS